MATTLDFDHFLKSHAFNWAYQQGCDGITSLEYANWYMRMFADDPSVADMPHSVVSREFFEH